MIVPRRACLVAHAPGRGCSRRHGGISPIGVLGREDWSGAGRQGRGRGRSGAPTFQPAARRPLWRSPSAVRPDCRTAPAGRRDHPPAPPAWPLNTTAQRLHEGVEPGFGQHRKQAITEYGARQTSAGCSNAPASLPAVDLAASSLWLAFPVAVLPTANLTSTRLCQPTDNPISTSGGLQRWKASPGG
jgi:hypothetical protein